jgi:hypothetical protein
MADTQHLYDPLPHPSFIYRSRDFLGYPRVIASRTLKPVKYYLIDYGLSKVYKSEDAPFLENPGWGGDRSVPEFQTVEPHPVNPFPVDVYCVGNVARRYFLEVRILPRNRLQHNSRES